VITVKKFLIFIFISFFLNSISLGDTVSDSNTTTEEPNKAVKTSDYNLAKRFIRKADKYESKNKSKKAIKYYNKAIKLLHSSNKTYSANANTFNYLGYAKAKLGFFEDAEIYYILGLELDPNHISININLGKLYIDLNRIDEAKERLEFLKNCNCKEFEDLNDLLS